MAQQFHRFYKNKHTHTHTTFLSYPVNKQTRTKALPRQPAAEASFCIRPTGVMGTTLSRYATVAAADLMPRGQMWSHTVQFLIDDEYATCLRTIMMSGDSREPRRRHTHAETAR